MTQINIMRFLLRRNDKLKLINFVNIKKQKIDLQKILDFKKRTTDSQILKKLGTCFVISTKEKLHDTN
jgi:hypothetical protein